MIKLGEPSRIQRKIVDQMTLGMTKNCPETLSGI